MLSSKFLRVVATSRTLGARSAGFPAAKPTRLLPIVQRRTFTPREWADPKVIDDKYPDYPQLSDAADPDMNGGYINPPRVKRQFRDPHGDWWDKQERRNLGETLHEDNDTLGIFSPWENTWISPGQEFLHLGLFVAALLAVVGGIYMLDLPRPAYPRQFEGGLARELGGPGAARARMDGDPDP